MSSVSGQYLGGSKRGNSLPLFLIINDDNNEPVNADILPVYKLVNANDSVLVSGVLNHISTGYYMKSVLIPQSFSDGSYAVIYETLVGGKNILAKDTFRIGSVLDVVIDYEEFWKVLMTCDKYTKNEAGKILLKVLNKVENVDLLL